MLPSWTFILSNLTPDCLAVFLGHCFCVSCTETTPKPPEGSSLKHRQWQGTFHCHLKPSNSFESHDSNTAAQQCSHQDPVEPAECPWHSSLLGSSTVGRGTQDNLTQLTASTHPLPASRAPCSPWPPAMMTISILTPTSHPDSRHSAVKLMN